jgi:hypothetical protein
MGCFYHVRFLAMLFDSFLAANLSDLLNLKKDKIEMGLPQLCKQGEFTKNLLLFSGKNAMFSTPNFARKY